MLLLLGESRSRIHKGLRAFNKGVEINYIKSGSEFSESLSTEAWEGEDMAYEHHT